MPRQPEKQKGFTLIELLIVVVIISILTLLAFASFTSIQRAGRDTQRKGDLQSIAGVLQRFYSDWSIYPNSDSSGRIVYNSSNCGDTSGSGSQSRWGDGSVVNGNVNGLLCNSTNYTRNFPQDPLKRQPEYCYTVESGNQNYTLYAQMEGRGNISGTEPCASRNYNYKITGND